jgi:uroporphyrinogen decarboxylase
MLSGDRSSCCEVIESCKDRVKAALAFRETAFVPYAFGFSHKVSERLSRHYGMENPFVELGMHIFAVEAQPTKRPLTSATTPEESVDEFGVRWRSSPEGARYPVGHPLEEASLRAYEWPDPSAAVRFQHVSPTIARHSDRFIVAAVDNTLFERAYFLRGFEMLLSDMVLRPGYAHELLDHVLQFNLAILERLLECPVDGVWFGDDYGHQGGLLMSPRMWRTFIKPRLAVLFERARSAGLPVFLHSDGAVASLIPDLLEIGLNVINPCQPEAMDLSVLKQEYGGDLCFCGGISTQRTLSRGGPRDVENELRRDVAILGRNGGYVAATAGSVQPDVPLANLVHLLDLLRHQAEHPLRGWGEPAR